MLLEQPRLTTPLSIFVMEAAVVSPLTTGLELFWLLQIRKEEDCVRAAQMISYFMSTLDCGLLRDVYNDQLRLWGERGVFRRIYKQLSLKALVLGTENVADSSDSSVVKPDKIQSLQMLKQCNVLWTRMKCLSCFGLCSCRFVKSVRATLMTALLLLAFVVTHGESVMFVLLFLARLAVTKALQVT